MISYNYLHKCHLLRKEIKVCLHQCPQLVQALLKLYSGSRLHIHSNHGGLSQWGRSNMPRIMPGTVKSLNALWELCQPSDGTMPIKLTPVVCQSGQVDILYRIWSRTGLPQDRVRTRCYLAGQYKLFEFKFTTAQSEIGFIWRVRNNRKCKYSIQ